MGKKKYLVVSPKHAMKVKLDDQEKAKVQNIPKGTILSLEESIAASAVKSKKLKLYVAQKVNDNEGDDSQEELAEAKKDVKSLKKELTESKKTITGLKKELTEAKKNATNDGK